MHCMNQAQLSLYFALSLYIGLPLGVVGMLLWIRRVWPRVRKSAESQRHVNMQVIAFMSLFYVSPGLLSFLACSAPAIYFSHLLKQHAYCTDVVRHNINRGITQDDRDL